MFIFLRYKGQFKISMPCELLTSLLERLINETYANRFSFTGKLVTYKFKTKDGKKGFFTIYPVGRIGGLQGDISTEDNISLLRVQMTPQPYVYLLFLFGLGCLIGQLVWEFKDPLFVLAGIFVTSVIVADLWTLRCVRKAFEDILTCEEFNVGGK